MSEKGDKERGEIIKAVEEVSLERDKRGEEMLNYERDERNKKNWEGMRGKKRERSRKNMRKEIVRKEIGLRGTCLKS